MAYAETFVHMATIDSMPKTWRALVYEYGYVPVEAMYSEGVGIRVARTELEMHRICREDDHLRKVARGDYKIPKSAFFCRVGGFRSETELGLSRPKIAFTI